MGTHTRAITQTKYLLTASGSLLLGGNPSGLQNPQPRIVFVMYNQGQTSPNKFVLPGWIVKLISIIRAIC